MHKSIIILLLTVVIVSLGGCGGVSESDYQKVISERNTLKKKLITLQGDLDFLEKEYNALRKELKEQEQKVFTLRAAAQKIEAKERKSEQTPRFDEVKPEEAPPFYEVQPGDSLWTIARQFQTSVTTLKKLNNLENANIRIDSMRICQT